MGNTWAVLWLASCRTLNIPRLREGRRIVWFPERGPEGIGEEPQTWPVTVLVWLTCQAVWDSSMGPLLNWPALLGMLTGLSGTALAMVLSVDSVCTQGLLSHLPRRQAVDSGSSPIPCGSPQALSVLLQLNSLVCTVGFGWIPVFMI